MLKGLKKLEAMMRNGNGAAARLHSAVPDVFRAIENIANNPASNARIRAVAVEQLRSRRQQIAQAANDLNYSTEDRTYFAALAARVAQSG